MNVSWYEQQEVKDKLIVFGRALQGIDPYDVELEADPDKCYAGYCSFEQRQITVNPTLFPVSASEQYLFTKALLVHEAGHRRYTIPTVLPVNARVIANILEDERIDRRMHDEFIGVRWLIKKLTKRLYHEATAIDQASDSLQELFAFLLQLRWANRIAQPVKGELSAQNQQLWTKIQPLVEQAWQANHSEIVDRNAIEIAAILGLK